MVRFTSEELTAIGEWANDNFPRGTSIVLHSDHAVVLIDGEEEIYRIAEICDDY